MYDYIVEQWAAGAPAPFDLYDVDGVLVEAVGDDRAPIVNRGEPVPDDVARRVAEHHEPGATTTVLADVLVRDAAGDVVLDADGNPEVETVEIELPDRPIQPLTYVAEQVPAADDPCCDMCGETGRRLVTLGRGRYCDEPRQAPGETPDEARSCRDRRVEQMSSLR